MKPNLAALLLSLCLSAVHAAETITLPVKRTDYEKVWKAALVDKLRADKISDVSALKELKQLEELNLRGNPDLTKAQIDELKKALPKCKISSNPTK